MACLLVPAAEAVLVTAVTKMVKLHEAKQEEHAPRVSAPPLQEVPALPWSRKIRWLSNLLWGGAGLLAFEHVWHGEIVPWFPFLTKAANPEDALQMLHEMATTGVTMALLVTLAWGGMLVAAARPGKADARQERGLAVRLC